MDKYEGKGNQGVLLIGENAQGSSHLIKLLEGHGCHCSFATSHQEACLLLSTQCFDLVLGPTRLRECSNFPLLNLLEGSNVTMFYFQLVEDGCWWLPALRSGRRCFGSHALRPSDFVVSLNEVIAELRAVRLASVENEPALVSVPARPSRPATSFMVERRACSCWSQPASWASLCLTA